MPGGSSSYLTTGEDHLTHCYRIARNTAVEAQRRYPAFFAPCVMSTVLADIDRATIRVLQRSGCEVSNPGGQGCCGALHAHGGDLTRALTLARANIAAFEPTDGSIVVNSAGCGAMLKDYAHHLRRDPEWAERARKLFSARVRDLSGGARRPCIADYP